MRGPSFLVTFFILCASLKKCSTCQPKYDYSKLMEMNLEFYKMQRSGTLPDNDIPWRSSAFEDEKGENGEDLSGGYFDAGDTLKLNFKGAHMATTIAWSLLEYEDGYKEAGEYDNAWKALKWQTDYLLKCYVEDGGEKYIYAQCGDPYEHKKWENPNKMEEILRNNDKRHCYRVYHRSDRPGTDLAGEMAAALAASSMVFAKVGQSSYAKKLLDTAKDVYDLAKTTPRGLYHHDIKGAPSTEEGTNEVEYHDDLVWGAIWLYKATKQYSYLSYAKYRWRNDKLKSQLERDAARNRFSWANKFAAVALLIAKHSDNKDERDKAKEHVRKLCHYLKYDRKRLDNSASSGAKGMIYLNDFLPNRRVAKHMSLCFTLSKYFKHESSKYDFTKFATHQIHLLVGDAKSSEKSGYRQSFVVGFAKSSKTVSPQQPHHRASSCPAKGDCGYSYRDSNRPNLHVLTGGLVGGPTEQGVYEDIRKEYRRTEVSIAGMAGFQMSLAALLDLQSDGTCHFT